MLFGVCSAGNFILFYIFCPQEDLGKARLVMVPVFGYPTLLKLCVCVCVCFGVSACVAFFEIGFRLNSPMLPGIGSACILGFP